MVDRDYLHKLWDKLVTTACERGWRNEWYQFYQPETNVDILSLGYTPKESLRDAATYQLNVRVFPGMRFTASDVGLRLSLLNGLTTQYSTTEEFELAIIAELNKYK